jgi:hypothetical protein
LKWKSESINDPLNPDLLKPVFKFGRFDADRFMCFVVEESSSASSFHLHRYRPGSNSANIAQPPVVTASIKGRQKVKAAVGIY